MSSIWKTGLPRLLPIAVSGGVLVWLLREFDLSAVAAAFSPRVAIVMVPALIAFSAVTLWIEAMSIYRLVAHPPPGFGLWTAARIKCASYLPGIVHYGIGQGGLAVLLGRRAALSFAEALGLVLLITAADLIVALVVVAVAAANASANAMRFGARGLAALAVIGFVGGLALLRTRLPLGALERIRRLSLFEGLRRASLERIGEVLMLRVLFSACFVAGCASAFAAFQIPAPAARLIGNIMLVALLSALPIAVAGLGTSQAAFVYLFADLAPAPRLLAMSLALSFGILLLRAAMGLCFARELTREALHDARIAPV
jgi:hypothetical protein